MALRGPLAAADTVALLLASSLILLSTACACSCNVVSCCPFFFPLVMNRHGDAVAFWAEPAGWRSVSRPRPSMPYSLLATHYQLLKITSRQVARSSPSPGRDLGFFFLCIIVDIVVDIALWWSWNCPRTTRRSLHPQRLRLLKMCWWWYFWLLWLMERDRW